MRKTIFYTDVKTPVFAGMKFRYRKGETTDNNLREVGGDIIRLYYDDSRKDCLVGEERIKRTYSVK